MLFWGVWGGRPFLVQRVHNQNGTQPNTQTKNWSPPNYIWLVSVSHPHPYQFLFCVACFLNWFYVVGRKEIMAAGMHKQGAKPFCSLIFPLLPSGYFKYHGGKCPWDVKDAGADRDGQTSFPSLWFPRVGSQIPWCGWGELGYTHFSWGLYVPLNWMSNIALDCSARRRVPESKNLSFHPDTPGSMMWNRRFG